MEKTILIIEDNITLNNLYKQTVEKLGYKVVCFFNAEDAYTWLQSNTPYLMLLDYILPNMNGKELIIKLKEENKTIPPFIIITGSGNEKLFIEMMKFGARDYMVKEKDFIEMLPIIIENIDKDIQNEIEFKNTIKKLNENEFKLRRAELLSKTGNWELHLDTNIIIPSQGAMSIYNIFEKEINYDIIKKNVLDEYREYLDESIKNLIEKNTPYEVKFKIKPTDKDEIIDIYSSATYDKKRRIVFGTIQDITINTKKDEELEKIISLLKATLESTEDGILVTDNNRKTIQYNQTFIDMWEIPEEMIKKGDDEETLNFRKNKLKNPEEFIEKVNYLYFNKEESSLDILEFINGRFFERYSIPQKINNKTVGRVWSFHDITDIKKIESDLIIAKNRAEESDKLKSEFLANMSHEIRTPMNAILGFTSLLDKNLPTKKYDDYINTIKNSGQLLMTILEDIIDLSKIQSGIFKIEKEYFNVRYLIMISEEEYNQNIKLKGKENIKLILELDYNEIELYSDNTRIKQILNNLVDNAIKFTNEGMITYGYHKTNNIITFFVKDTGIGISEDNINKIYDRFYQIKDITKVKQVGTGLGLTICKSIVELLGGEIWVESELGVGSSFYFSIPIE